METDFPRTHTLKPKRAEIASRVEQGPPNAAVHFTRSSPGFLLIRALLRGLLRLLFRVHLRGGENIPPGSYVLVSNHLNWIDGFLLMALFPAEPSLYLLADQDAIHRTWWKRLVVTAVGRVITIDRSHASGDRDALRAAYRVLEEGHVLALFPEGRVGEREGEVAKAQRGVGALCLHSDRPVLPVGLIGVSELYLGKEITVMVGKPFTPAPAGSSMREKVNHITHQVQEALEKTLPPYTEKPVAHKPMRWLTHLLS